jgi:hypothetical protein
MTINYTYIPIGRNIFQVTIGRIYIPTYFFIPRPSKIYPNLDFGFENIPSDNSDGTARGMFPFFFYVRQADENNVKLSSMHSKIGKGSNHSQ